MYKIEQSLKSSTGILSEFKSWKRDHGLAAGHRPFRPSRPRLYHWHLSGRTHMSPAFSVPDAKRTRSHCPSTAVNAKTPQPGFESFVEPADSSSFSP